MIKKILIILLLFISFGVSSIKALEVEQWIIYGNGNDGRLYKKDANNNDNGSPITSVYADYLSYSPDGQWIIYSNGSDGNKLYKKDANNSDNGIPITLNDVYYLSYSPDGQWIIYSDGIDGNKLYKKDANDDNDIGSPITSIRAPEASYSPDGQWIIYTNVDDGYKLYKKDANDDNDNGSRITSVSARVASYSPDGQWIIYTNADDGNKLYKKDANDDNDNGNPITSVHAGEASYSPDGQWIIYTNADDGYKLYKKDANNSDNGSPITSVRANSGKYSKTFIPIINGSCGSAQKTYTPDAVNFSGNFCNSGEIDKIPFFINSGSVSRNCKGVNGGEDAKCIAYIPVKCPTILNQDGSCSVATSPSNIIFTNLGKTQDNNDLTCTQYINNQTSKYQNTSKGEAMTAAAADPVNLATGEFDFVNKFLSIPGKGLNYEFEVTYRNQMDYDGILGYGWDHNYNKYLVEEENGNILYYNGKLGVVRFIKNTSGTYDYNIGVKANLVLDNGIYKLIFDNKEIIEFNSDKKISKLIDKNNNFLSFTYDETKKLIKVIDTNGKNIDYIYENGLLKEVRDNISSKVNINYFASGSLLGATNDLKEFVLNNNSNLKTVSFEYDNSHNITKLFDAKGVNYVTNIYENDRVKTQTYGNGDVNYEYVIGENNNVLQNTIIDREGNKSIYYYNQEGNNIKTEYISGDKVDTYLYEYNSDGLITIETKPRGNTIYYKYDARGNLLEKRYKPNVMLALTLKDIFEEFTYNSNNQILTHRTQKDTLITYDYDSYGNVIKKTTSKLKSNDGLYDKVETFEYSPEGNLIKSINANLVSTNYSYSGGLLTKVSIGGGEELRETKFEYNNYGVLTKKIDPNGNITLFEINDFNQVTKTISPEGIISSMIYDENNNIIDSKIELDTNISKYIKTKFDILDNPIEIEENINELEKKVTKIIYDKNSKIIEKQIGDNAKITYKYNNYLKVIEERIILDILDNSKDLVTKYEYDSNGNMISKINSKGIVTKYEYDLYDRVFRITKADGSFREIGYYGMKNEIFVITDFDKNNIVLSRTEYDYDGLGNIILERKYNKIESDPKQFFSIPGRDYTILNGIVRPSERLYTFGYYAEVTKTNENNITTKNYYDKAGNLIKKVDALNNTTTYEYNIFDELIKTTDSLGNIIINKYDKNGNIIEKELIQSTGKSNYNFYYYDKDNRLIKETNSLGNSKSYVYNNFNQIISKTDENGNVINYSYDYLGNILQTKEILKDSIKVTSYKYDIYGNLIELTDSNNNITKYNYNNLNQLVSQVYPDNKVYNFEYDNLGRLVKKTDANGTIVTNIYDDLDRIIQKDILPGNGVLGVTKETFEYDGLSRLTKSNDSNNRQLTFEYDLFSRLALESQNTEIIKYNYDNNNNLISLENNLNITNYSYDELSRVKDIKFNNEIISNYTYNGLENSKITFGNNNQTTKTYDNLLRLETLTNSIKNHNFTYDKVGNITSNGEKNYIYDELYNLNQVTKSGSGDILENYTYDLPGNRVKDDKNIYEINNLNQITNISNSGSENKNYLYDNNGNLIQDNDKKYFYDYKNRLVKVENLTTKEIIGEYFYDTLSRRYKKVTKTEVINYIYSNENILSEKYLDNTQKYYINGIGTDNLVGFVLGKPDFSELEASEYEFCTTKVLIYKDDFIKFGYQNIVDRCLVLQEKTKNLIFKKYYFEKDNIGSIIGISNDNGEIISSYEYDSFGNILNNSNLNFKNSRFFTSREFDEEIGFYYYRARYYNPKTGKFIQRDPIDIADDVNLYVYVGNNPVNFVDPSGMEKKMLSEKLIISIFDSAMNDTGGFNLYQIHDGTRNSGPYDIKRNAFIEAKAQQNGGVIKFNGVDVEPSNLGNLLFGMNTANNYIPSFVARDILMTVEIDNAEKEGYGKYAEEIAKWDENSDEVWYDKGEDIYSQYVELKTFDEKVNLITNAIATTNPEYNKRSKIEQEKRQYYFNLLNK